MAFDPDAYIAQHGTAVAEPPAFDPDAYLAKYTPPAGPFDPDAYLAKAAPVAGTTQSLKAREDAAADAAFAAGDPSILVEVARARALDAQLGSNPTPMQVATATAYPIPSIPQQEGVLPQLGAAVGNTVIGAANFMASPLGAATAALPVAPAAVKVAAGGLFGTDLAYHGTKQVIEAPTLQGKAEGALSVGMGLLAGAGGIESAKKPSVTPVADAAIHADISRQMAEQSALEQLAPETAAAVRETVAPKAEQAEPISPPDAGTLQTLPEKVKQPGGESTPQKEPWQMTRAEYAQQGGEISNSAPRGVGAHRDIVEEALASGKNLSPEVLKDYPYLAADLATKPYAEGLRNLSDKQLKAEEKRTSTELNQWANRTPALLPDDTINPALHTPESFEVSSRFNAVNREIEARKAKSNEQTQAQDVPALPPDKAGAAPETGSVPVPAVEAGAVEQKSEGPGAAASSEPLTPSSNLAQLSDIVSRATSDGKSLGDRITISERIGDEWKKVQDASTGALGKLKAVGGAISKTLTEPIEVTDFRKSVGDWSYAIQRADHEALQFAKAVKKGVANPVRREAITNWIQAEGNPLELQTRAGASKDTRLRRGYEVATKLTPEETVLAQNISQYLDSKLQEGIDHGIFKNGGVENYVTQLWQRPNPITNKLIGDLQMGKLPVTLKFAKQRIFGSYFEGEQAGFKPITKDIGALISIYDNAFSKTVAARAFVKSLHESKAKDGRPLVEVAGQTSNVPSGEAVPEATLVRPKSKPEEVADYRPIDHASLRGWKWATTGENGQPVMVQGDMLVHPEIYTHLQNVLSSSPLRQNAFTKGLLEAQGFAKSTKLSLSPFHSVQEGVHALFHRVNPFAPERLNFDDPIQEKLVRAGLQVAEYHPLQDFSEGLGGKGGAVGFIPGVGRLWARYNDYLFKDYIPGLKMSMAKHALERNTERYGKKLSEDQIAALTASQSNAAFGELNYRMMGRSPLRQDLFRIATLAPDFLEARAKFVGQAFTKHGAEQRMALALMGSTLFVASRILNKILDDDYHWNHPFTVFHNGREYKLRTVLGDVEHLATDPQMFIANRLSPLTRLGMEALTGRDSRGINRTSFEQMKDLASWLVPIPATVQSDSTIVTQALGASGVGSKQHTAVMDVFDKANKWKKTLSDPRVKAQMERSAQETNATSDYRVLRDELSLDKPDAARKEVRRLVTEKGKSLSDIQKAFDHPHPFTGSKELEEKFKRTLSAEDTKIYNRAVTERRELASKLRRLPK